MTCAPTTSRQARSTLISAGVLTDAEAARLEERVCEPDFLGCGFAYIGAWGRRPGR